MTGYFFVLIVGVFAGTIGGVIGTGSSIILLPVLVFTFGPLQAVPIMAVAAMMVNFARAIAWWREIDWRALAAYSLPAIPAAALGARTLISLPPALIDTLLGLFFLAMIPGRRILEKRGWRATWWQLAIAGVLIGFLTGIVISTGPLSVPVFAAAGLMKGALLATEATASLFIYVTKVTTFERFGALSQETFIKGLLVGSSLMAGTFVGKYLVMRTSADTFAKLLDAMLACSGLALLWAAYRA
ncbi:MAG: sulfite exporter TauE/SafE family protein [Xanthobacteraceae bacterium]|nr:sulfite exporter TauE/SafE family protein [Xanthobacteraceae bacterium]